MPSVVGAVNISNVLVSSSVEFGDCLAIKPKSTANTIDMDIKDQNVVGNA
ncbi:spore germination protein [Bacillus sp. S35]|nr:spore germination protein [Priestia aryabhattai]MBK0005878.1 spore germination protein [Bacillus sp. S35]MCM3640258.1 spore germination protein [Priestia aryabhattai]